MVQQEWMTKVEKMADEACHQVGCFLYDIEFLGTGAGRTLRVYIDKEAENGAGIEDCSNVSKSLNEFLDADENLIPGGNYNLEVSTPGVDRPLRKAWHFQKAIGKKIWLKTSEPLETLGTTIEKYKKSKQLEAKLSGVDNETLVMEVKEGDLRIPVAAVEKAKMVFEFNKGKKK